MKAQRIIMYGFLGAFLLAIITAVRLAAAGEGGNDISGHWAESYIVAMSRNGVIAGMPDGSFRPDDSITLQQFVTLIMRCEYGEIDPVYGGDWASGYMHRALEYGIINHEDMANPGYISRFYAATIVHRALLNMYEEEVDVYVDDLVVMLQDQPACTACCNPYFSEVEQNYAMGIISGRPGAVFDGGANLTRAEACVLIMRMIEPRRRTPPNGN